MGASAKVRAEREAKVLAAARELFGARGFRQTSLRQIAERAEVPLSAVQSAGTKSELFERMFGPPETAALLGRFSSWVAHPGDDFVDELDQVFAPWFANADVHPEYVRDFIVTTMDQSGDARTRSRDGELVTRAIASRLRRWYPRLSAKEADDLAFGMFALEITALVGVLAGTFTATEARAQVRATARVVLPRVS